MDINSVDEKIREVLIKHTDVTGELKDKIWEHLDQELFGASLRKKKIVQLQKKPKKSWMAFLVTTVAAMIIFLGIQTQPGLALVDQIKQLFAPEKENIQSIEGIEEKTNVSLEEGMDSTYVLYVDKERYQFTQGKESDRVTFKGTLPKDTPEVNMEIKQERAKNPEQIAKKIEANLKQKYQEVNVIGEINEPIKGWAVIGRTGNKWNSPVEKVYVVSNQQKGSFVITQRYFLEAEEGHGARFDAMLKDFHIIVKQKEK